MISCTTFAHKGGVRKRGNKRPIKGGCTTKKKYHSYIDHVNIITVYLSNFGM
jgi:hypothetical protein